MFLVWIRYEIGLILWEYSVRAWTYYRTWPLTEWRGVSIEHLGWVKSATFNTPPDTWYHSIWDFHMLFLLRPIFFSKPVVNLRTLYFEHSNVLSRFYMVQTTTSIRKVHSFYHMNYLLRQLTLIFLFFRLLTLIKMSTLNTQSDLVIGLQWHAVSIWSRLIGKYGRH